MFIVKYLHARPVEGFLKWHENNTEIDAIFIRPRMLNNFILIFTACRLNLHTTHIPYSYNRLRKKIEWEGSSRWNKCVKSYKMWPRMACPTQLKKNISIEQKKIEVSISFFTKLLTLSTKTLFPLFLSKKREI